MAKFVITFILLLAEGTIVSLAALPEWTGGNTVSIDLSMLSSTVCDSKIASVDASTSDGEPVTFTLIPNNYGITLNYDSFYFNYNLHCTWSSLTAIGSSVSSFDVVVSGHSSGGVVNKTFTFVLKDRQHAPEFHGPLTFTVTECDLSSGKYSDDDVIHTVSVTDDNEGDIVTLTITTSGTPFSFNGFKIMINSISALISIFENTDTYTFDIQANDTKHTTPETISVTHDKNSDCNEGSSTDGNNNGNGNSNGNSTGNGDDDNGFNTLTYNIFIIGFLIVMTRVVPLLDK